MKRRHGFTFIELIVVIGIIMLLAGLMMAGLNSAGRRAKKARARRDVDQITTAWNVYYADYRRFPDAIFDCEPDITITEMGAAAIQILRGTSTNLQYQAKNPRRQEYMDFHQAVTNFSDPWKNPYQIVLDDIGGNGYDGNISVPVPDGSGDSEVIRHSVAVYSKGRDGDEGTADDVCSWRDR
jgi:type II secretory pathway pseudopilin PulG